MDLSYAQKVVASHANMSRALGAFKPPTLNTVIAAEAFKARLLRHTDGRPYQGTMAVSVTEVEDLKNESVQFVVAFSGDHDFRINDLYNMRLQRWLKTYGTGTGRERFWYAGDLDKVYSPMHKVSEDFYKMAFDGFRTDTPITIGQIAARIDGFKNMFDPNTQLKVEKKNLSRKERKKNYAGVIGGALGLRMQIVRNTDVPAAVRAVRGFIKYLKTTGGTEVRWKKLASFLDQVLTNEKVSKDDGPMPDTTFVSFLDVDHQLGDKHLKSVLNAAINGWGGAAFGRYCAEPKGYSAVRQLYARGHASKDRAGEKVGNTIQWAWLNGQLAFWYSSEGRTFSVQVVEGPSGAPGASTSGAYMVPCSSCATRSSEMLVGI